MSNTIHINCDLGEGAGNDAAIMPFISACNVACGGHYGNEQTMLQTIQLAQANGVEVGAHPSFPDRVNFGRAILDLDSEALKATVYEQIMTMHALCVCEGVQMQHVKLHGALYNLAAKDQKVASTVLAAFQQTGLHFKVYAPFGSIFKSLTQAHFEVLTEAFIDRRYQEDLSLMPRSEANAVLEDEETAWKQLLGLSQQQKLTVADGKQIGLSAETFCIHGDAPRALPILQYIRQKMDENQLTLHKDAAK